MKLSEVKPKVYVDMDGVLSNFDKRVREILGRKPANARELWAAVKPYIESGEFWSTFEIMPDARTLWNYVKKYDPTILTASGYIERQKTEVAKKAWAKRHLGASKVIVVAVSKEKAKLAKQTSVLIDDSERSINPWVAAGGIGILHKSASDTIRQLKNLGF